MELEREIPRDDVRLRVKPSEQMSIIFVQFVVTRTRIAGGPLAPRSRPVDERIPPTPSYRVMAYSDTQPTNSALVQD